MGETRHGFCAEYREVTPIFRTPHEPYAGGTRPRVMMAGTPWWGWPLSPNTVPLPEFLHEALQGSRAVDRPVEVGLPVLGQRLAIDSPGEGACVQAKMIGVGLVARPAALLEALPGELPHAVEDE